MTPTLVKLALFTLLPICVIALGYALHARGRKTPRGTEPGQGDTLVEGGAITGGIGGGYSSITRVPRDPQTYAKGFVPAKARKSK